MYFLYKTKKLTNKKLNETRLIIELFDFVTGNVQKIVFNSDKYINIAQQLREYLKDVKFSYAIKDITNYK